MTNQVEDPTVEAIVDVVERYSGAYFDHVKNEIRFEIVGILDTERREAIYERGYAKGRSEGYHAGYEDGHQLGHDDCYKDIVEIIHVRIERLEANAEYVTLNLAGSGQAVGALRDYVQLLHQIKDELAGHRP